MTWKIFERKSKKGGTLDNIYVVISFFSFALFMLLASVMWNQFTSTEVQDDVWDQTTQGTNAKNRVENAYNKLDSWVLMIYIFLHLGILVLAFMLRTHPVMYVAAIFITIILAMLAAPLANAYEDVTADSEFAVAAAEYPKTAYIMNHLPMFEVIWSFVTIVVMLGLARMEGFV